MSEPSARITRNRGRWTLVGLFLLFFLPIVFAWLLNVETPAWLPSGRSNHGDLIQPPMSFPLADLRTVASEPVPSNFLRGQWTLVYVERSNCMADCDRAVYLTRQVRFALGKDMQRIQRVLVAPTESVREIADKVQRYDENMSIVAADPEWFERASFIRPGFEIYLVDPQGYLVLSYAKAVEPSGLIRDLKRLLKISKIG